MGKNFLFGGAVMSTVACPKTIWFVLPQVSSLSESPTQTAAPSLAATPSCGHFPPPRTLSPLASAAAGALVAVLAAPPAPSAAPAAPSSVAAAAAVLKMLLLRLLVVEGRHLLLLVHRRVSVCCGRVQVRPSAAAARWQWLLPPPPPNLAHLHTRCYTQVSYSSRWIVLGGPTRTLVYLGTLMYRNRRSREY